MDYFYKLKFRILILEIYKEFEEALRGESEDRNIDQHKRVRRYVSDCQFSSRAREQEIMEFVQRISKEELKSLNSQVNREMRYAKIVYR